MLIALVAIAAIAAAWLLWRSSQRSTVASSSPAGIETRPEFPRAGLLVPEGVLQSADSTSAAIWEALEAAATPVAVEYYPVSDSEIAKFRFAPVNAADQQAIETIVDALRPKSQTLFRVKLPKDAELVKAVGTSGYRGFSRSRGKTQHAVLKPVTAGGKVAASLPLLAVSATVLAVDMMAQREQLAHQRRVEAKLGRQEERYYIERVKDQRSADAQLSRAISLLLDGRNPNLELALKSADDEFLRSQPFLEKFRGVIGALVEEDGKVDYHRLEEALGGKTKEVDHFLREFHLSRAAVAIRRKALVADAAAVALSDPDNPYTALRKFLDAEVHELEQADAALSELTEQLMSIELKGRWHNRDKSVTDRQTWLRAQIAPPTVDSDADLRYLVTASGEILQLLPSAEVEDSQVVLDE